MSVDGESMSQLKSIQTRIESSEGDVTIGREYYWIYNVVIPIAVKNPRWETDCDEDSGAIFGVIEHDGYFAAETLEHEPLEFQGDVVDIFNDELRDAIRADWNECD